jgi:hypothetical protein
MKALRVATCVLTALITVGWTVLWPIGARAQTPFRFAGPGELPAIDAETRAAIIDSVCTALNTSYVFADTAASIETLFRSNMSEGAYETLRDPADFTARLLEDMLSVYRDTHFALRAMYPADPSMEEEQEEDIDQDKRLAALRAKNFGFRRVEILPGNIGYLELTEFADATFGGETAAAAMNLLGNCDALIIDLRKNPGGSASMIRLISSYLLGERTHLVSWYQRETDETIQSWSQAWVPGMRLVEEPVYVLTSNRTGSAAEEFTYNLKNLERATIIGETTGGGAHTVSYHVFDFDRFRVGLKLPSGRALSPITGTNWEGTGVTPDIEVPADDALLAAQVEALKVLQEEAADDDAKMRLAWAQRSLENQLNPVTLTEEELEAYVGTFGPRRFFIEDGDLYYEREGRPKLRLLAMGQDLFRLDGLDYFRLQFKRDDDGLINLVIGLYDDGQQDPSPRTE